MWPEIWSFKMYGVYGCLVFIHLVYGGVARKLELLGLKVQNVPSGFRGLIIWDNMVCLLTFRGFCTRAGP